MKPHDSKGHCHCGIPFVNKKPDNEDRKVCYSLKNVNDESYLRIYLDLSYISCLSGLWQTIYSKIISCWLHLPE